MWSELIQVAGVSSLAEAWMLEDCGVPILGFPLRLDTHKPDVSEREAGRIIANFKKKETRGMAITYECELSGLLDLVECTGAHGLQFHADLDVEVVAAFRKRKPEHYLIKSLVLGREPFSLVEARMLRFEPYVDAFITDTFDPKTGASGATGKLHDWKESQALRERAARPLILAGGLRPANLAAAIAQVRPAGVDVHSGVEDASGAKDPALVGAFMRIARESLARFSAP